uniref:Uncharacterized protein n=1 Tax=Glossina pallidipes TaxID=7398 RepID=A0A1A9ZF32_GLOPL
MTQRSPASDLCEVEPVGAWDNPGTISLVLGPQIARTGSNTKPGGQSIAVVPFVVCIGGAGNGGGSGYAVASREQLGLTILIANFGHSIAHILAWFNFVQTLAKSFKYAKASAGHAILYSGFPRFTVYKFRVIKRIRVHAANAVRAHNINRDKAVSPALRVDIKYRPLQWRHQSFYPFVSFALTVPPAWQTPHRISLYLVYRTRVFPD